MANITHTVLLVFLPVELNIMMSIPAILYPVVAAFAAIIFGRIGTIIMDQFRKDDMAMAANQLEVARATSKQGAMANHG